MERFLGRLTTLDRAPLLLGQRDRLPEVGSRVNEFLGAAVAEVRERFGGKITYAAVPLERVDWTLFDIVSLDLYRSAEIADRF